MDFTINDYAKATLGSAKDVNDPGASLSDAKINGVVNYLNSPGSGVDANSSFADYLNKGMSANPPVLNAGNEYLFYSGKSTLYFDAKGNSVSNGVLSNNYARATGGMAQTIGNTAWGDFIKNADATPEWDGMQKKFDAYLKRPDVNIEPVANASDTLKDMMWNAGSSPFMENAMNADKPLRAFIDGAPNGRGFSNFELPTAMSYPDAVINGYPVKAFGTDPAAALDFARRSGLEFDLLEKNLAQSATINSGKLVSVSDIQANVKLTHGYDAVNKTAFSQPVDEFSKLNIDQMTSTSQSWMRANNSPKIAGRTSEPEPVRSAVESHPHTGPPESIKAPSIAQPEMRIRTPAVEPASPIAAETAARGLGAADLAVKGLEVAAVAGVAYEGLQTNARAADLRQQGNIVGANSEVGHFYLRTGGMLAGAEAGAALGAAAGIETGPGALVTGGVGAIVGTVGGEKIAQAVDQYHIYNQSDKAGNSWTMDPQHPTQGWTRNVPTGQLDTEAMRYSEGLPVQQMRTLTADPALSNELNYKASNVAIGLTLDHPPTPRDPYTIPANEHDTRSLRESPWTHDAQSHQWTRQVADGLIDRNVMDYKTEVANPQRAAQLDHASQQIIADNVAHSPQSLAQDYQSAYKQQGWQQYGPVPGAVTSALRTPANTLEASDSHIYTHGADGQWTTPGRIWGTNAAEGNVRAELDATQHEASNERIAASRTQAPTQGQNLAHGEVAHAPTQGQPIQSHGSMAGPSRSASANGSEKHENERAKRPRFDDPAHPGHEMYTQIHSHISKIDSDLGRKPDQHTANLAGALTVAAKEQGLTRVDRVAPNADGSRFVASQTIIPRAVSEHAQVDIAQAVKTPLEQSSAQHMQTQAQAHALAQGQAQRQEQMQNPQQQPQGQQPAQGPQITR